MFCSAKSEIIFMVEGRWLNVHVLYLLNVHVLYLLNYNLQNNWNSCNIPTYVAGLKQNPFKADVHVHVIYTVTTQLAKPLESAPSPPPMNLSLR